MEEIKEHLHLDVMTVTGKTLGENLEELKRNGFYEKCEKWLQEFNKRYHVNVTKEDIIRPYDKAIGTDGSIAVLRGNLAPEGAVIKHTACPKEMFRSVLRARPFDSEEECIEGLMAGKVVPGDVVVVRYEGPKGGPGMREMFKAMKFMYGAGLSKSCALITDGRFSGTNNGCFVGHISPEAADGGQCPVAGGAAALCGTGGQAGCPEPPEGAGAGLRHPEAGGRHGAPVGQNCQAGRPAGPPPV